MSPLFLLKALAVLVMLVLLMGFLSSCESNSSTETLESVPGPVVVEPNVVSQPKVWPDAPIIEEYKSDSDDEYVIQPSKEQEKPSFAFVNTVKHVKTPRETVKEQNTYSPSPKANKRDWNGLMSKRLGLGYGFTKKACFVCGSFSHLIKDCDFHEKRMAKQVELNKKKGKGTGQRENRLLILLDKNPFSQVAETSTARKVNTARQNPFSQAAETSTARKVNTARPIVNEIRPRNNFYKSHSPIRRPFNRTTSPKANFSNQKVTIAKVKAVSDVRGKRETAIKPSAATLCTIEDGVPGIFATIDRKVKVLASKASIRRHLNLEDSEGLSSLPNAEIFEQLANTGTALTKLILRVKKLEKQVQKAAKQGRSVGLTQTYTRRRRNVGTISGGVSTASKSDSTAGGKAKDKGKEIMQEPKPLKKLKKRIQVQMSMDEEIAKKMFEEEQAKDKYVAEILKKFDFVSVKTASTPIETQKSLTKDEEAADVDVSGIQQEVVNFLAGDLFHGSARRRQLWLLLLQRHSMLLLPTAVGNQVQFLYCYIECITSIDALVQERKSAVWIGFEGTTWKLISWYCQAKLMLPGKVGATRHKRWCCQGGGKVCAACYVTTVFWNTASSQTVNDEKQIHATVDSKAVVVTEASIRSSFP
ncbi:hypothetical protein Tco_1108234 [Tanacetum coccineum]